MENSKQKIVDRFFESFTRHDIEGIRAVMSEKVKWYFMGMHPYAGVKKGIEEVVAFFDIMGRLMGESRPAIEKPIVSENDNHLIECVHTKSNRKDGISIDHHACVLWTFEDGKIIEGRHFFADQEQVNKYFNEVAKVDGVND